MSMDYNELYGISLKEYIKAHYTNLQKLMEKVQVDIVLLEKNLKKVIENSEDGITDSRVTIIHSTIKKKQKHLQRLKDWENENEKI
jgi:cob(I)alamin adenosyltransferase